MNDTRNVKGLAALQAALDSLPAKIEANIMRGALRAGAKVIATAAKDNIASHSGDLASSVRIGAKIDRAAGRVIGYVRAGGQKSAAFYAHMVEGGTQAHVIKAAPGSALAVGGGLYTQVQHPGARPHPFMRPALDSHAGAAVEASREYIRKRLAAKHGIDVPGPDDVDTAEA